MPLADHKRERFCASAIAGLLKHQAQKKQQAQLRVGSVLQALVEKVEFQKQQEDILELCNTTWAAW